MTPPQSIDYEDYNYHYKSTTAMYGEVPDMMQSCSSLDDSECSDADDSCFDCDHDHYFSQPYEVHEVKPSRAKVSSSPQTVLQPPVEEVKPVDVKVDLDAAVEEVVVVEEAIDASWSCLEEMVDQMTNYLCYVQSEEGLKDVEVREEKELSKGVVEEEVVEAIELELNEDENGGWMDDICGKSDINSMVQENEQRCMDEKYTTKKYATMKVVNRSAFYSVQQKRRHFKYLKENHTHAFRKSSFCHFSGDDDVGQKRYFCLDEVDVKMKPRGLDLFCAANKADVVCYDSDPEGFLPSHHSRVYNENDQVELEKDKEFAKNSLTLSSMSLHSFSDKDDYCSMVIREFLHANLLLKWHTENFEGGVSCWFEQGTRLRPNYNRKQGLIIQPRFVWRKTSLKSSSCPSKTKTRSLNFSQGDLNSIELLDIYRVLKATKDDKDTYPLANLNNCFVITTSNSGSYLFEASSKRERDDIIRGLKFLVSRLASMIIVGDDSVFQEFFNPKGTVPGSAPHIFNTSLSDESSSEGFIDAI